ncbi:unnamed protein product [Adineta steineri]|uniref:Major facilitator superfamily (MFS) profile domain-containing protein n=2 Tax=Adineta steineri TaxID=433720 RepID=A0A815J938_9BILA|nr:unnamed protein product [Adineta steineri]CAF3592635.1 unnamed protein product [Adineta steineri]
MEKNRSKLYLTRTSYRPYVTSFEKIQFHQYRGKGTIEEPYMIDWLLEDAENCQTWNPIYKWALTIFVSVAATAVLFCSSVYVGEFDGLTQDFQPSREIITLGISVNVLGFALGPLIWAPFSEVFGRRIIFIITFVSMTAFNAGSAASQNIWTHIILRFFAGAFGSSAFANSSGTIADLYPANQRGLPLTIFAAAPFLGPVFGSIIGGFTGAAIGWRWIQGIMAIFTGILSIIGIVGLPETYAPVLLYRRAEKLRKITDLFYRSKFEAKSQVTLSHLLKISFSRPWIFLFREPIVLFFAIYMAVIYGIMYMLLGAFPIVYHEQKGWAPGIDGLPFLGMALGIVIGTLYCIWDKRRYTKVTAIYTGTFVPPEARLPPAIVGAFGLPIGLFWFAWTNYSSIHFIVPILAIVPFGFGIVLVFVALINYMIDTYTIYAATVMAANSILRSLFGAAFPLFTARMFRNLGIQWAASIAGFLALLCLPLPYIFWKYGEVIRAWSKYSSEGTASKLQLNETKTNVESNASMIYVTTILSNLSSVIISDDILEKFPFIRTIITYYKLIMSNKTDFTIFNIILKTIFSNLNNDERAYRYDNIVRQFAASVYILGGRTAYEFLRLNILVLLPSVRIIQSYIASFENHLTEGSF